MDKLAIGIGVIIGACSAIFVQNVRILSEIRHMWLSINRMQDAELKVLKLTLERLNGHLEMLKSMSDTQGNIANLLRFLAEQEKKGEQCRTK